MSVVHPEVRAASRCSSKSAAEAAGSRSGESPVVVVRRDFHSAEARRRSRPHTFFGQRNLGEFGSFVYLVNQVFGASLVAVPLVFKSAGLLPATVVNIFVCCSSAIASLMLLRCMQLVHGNSCFQKRIEYAACVSYFLGKHKAGIVQLCLYIAMQGMCAISIVVVSQASDQLLLFSFGKTAGFEVYPQLRLRLYTAAEYAAFSGVSLPWEPPGGAAVGAAAEAAAAAAKAEMSITLGYVICAICCIPLCSSSMEENMLIQYISFFFLLLSIAAMGGSAAYRIIAYTAAAAPSGPTAVAAGAFAAAPMHEASLLKQPAAAAADMAFGPNGFAAAAAAAAAAAPSIFNTGAAAAAQSAAAAAENWGVFEAAAHEELSILMEKLLDSNSSQEGQHRLLRGLQDGNSNSSSSNNSSTGDDSSGSSAEKHAKGKSRSSTSSSMSSNTSSSMSSSTSSSMSSSTSSSISSSNSSSISSSNSSSISSSTSSKGKAEELVTLDSLPPKLPSFWGSQNLLKVLSTFIANYSYVTFVPCWANEMKLDVKIEMAVWRSTTFCGLTYFLFGVLLAAAYPAVSSDNILQEMLISSDTPFFAQIAIFTFDLFTILPGILVYCIATRYNLVNSGVCSKRQAFWVGAVAPFLVSWSLMNAQYTASVLTWTSLFFSLVCNFVAPFAIYLRACAKLPSEQPGAKQVVLFSPNIRHNVQGELLDPNAIRMSLLRWLQMTFKDESKAKEADPQLLHLLLQPSAAAAAAGEQHYSSNSPTEEQQERLMLCQQEAATTAIAAAALQLHEPGLSKTFSRIIGVVPTYQSDSTLHTPEQPTLLAAETAAAAAAAAAAGDPSSNSLQQHLLRHDSLGPLRGSSVSGDYPVSLLPSSPLSQQQQQQQWTIVEPGDKGDSGNESEVADLSTDLDDVAASLAMQRHLPVLLLRHADYMDRNAWLADLQLLLGPLPNQLLHPSSAAAAAKKAHAEGGTELQQQQRQAAWKQISEEAESSGSTGGAGGELVSHAAAPDYLHSSFSKSSSSVGCPFAHSHTFPYRSRSNSLAYRARQSAPAFGGGASGQQHSSRKLLDVQANELSLGLSRRATDFVRRLRSSTEAADATAAETTVGDEAEATAVLLKQLRDAKEHGSELSFNLLLRQAAYAAAGKGRRDPAHLPHQNSWSYLHLRGGILPRLRRSETLKSIGSFVMHPLRHLSSPVGTILGSEQQHQHQEPLLQRPQPLLQQHEEFIYQQQPQRRHSCVERSPEVELEEVRRSCSHASRIVGSSSNDSSSSDSSSSSSSSSSNTSSTEAIDTMQLVGGGGISTTRKLPSPFGSALHQQQQQRQQQRQQQELVNFAGPVDTDTAPAAAASTPQKSPSPRGAAGKTSFSGRSSRSSRSGSRSRPVSPAPLENKKQRFSTPSTCPAALSSSSSSSNGWQQLEQQGDRMAHGRRKFKTAAYLPKRRAVSSTAAAAAGPDDSSESFSTYRDTHPTEAHPVEALPTIQVTYADSMGASEEAQGAPGTPRLPRVQVFHNAWLRKHHIEVSRVLLAALVAFAAASIVIQIF